MKNISGLFFLIFILTTGKAYAYLDPGSGSYMLQILAGALATALFVIKQYWHKIKNIFRSDNRKNKGK